MKLLVIGIDGGTQEILEGMPMPFTQKLLAESKSRALKEDLLTRGWAQILTGEHASENKSFYLMPPCNKSYNFVQAYSKNDMLNAGNSDPLWMRLNNMGVSIGLLNIPTTGPADKVNGFIVAGGGGGLSPSGKIATEMVYPPENAVVLKEKKYVFDIRLPGGAKTVSEFFDKITQAQDVQKDTFLKLALRDKIDFGFHCFRMTTEIQYLARYEIQNCIEQISKAKLQGQEYKPQNPIHKALIKHYSQLDSAIKEFFESLTPENYFFVADHSTSLYELEGNIDVWLEERGYLRLMSRSELFIYKVGRKLNDVLREWKLLKPLPPFRKPMTRFLKGKTKAFGSFYDTGNFAGIFINDNRFGGPVKSQVEANRLVDEICQQFNQSTAAKKYELFAKPYRRTFKGAKYQHLMADIQIEKPDTVYFSGRHWHFMRENPNLKPMTEDLSGIRYPYTGLKGRAPLFVYSPNLENYISKNDPNDLRTAYRMICRYFEN